VNELLWEYDTSGTKVPAHATSGSELLAHAGLQSPFRAPALQSREGGRTGAYV